MQVNYSNQTNFSRLYLSKNLDGYQHNIAEDISKRLLDNHKNGESYIDEIKNIGYDVLIIPTEFYGSKEVRLCIIDNMEENRTPEGKYDYLDAKIIEQTSDYNFSPEEFLDSVKIRTAGFKSNFKRFISNLFSKKTG